MAGSSELEYYDYIELKGETKKAWYLKLQGFHEIESIWFPKSVCQIHEESNQIEVPEWLAEEKDMC